MAIDKYDQLGFGLPANGELLDAQIYDSMVRERQSASLGRVAFLPYIEVPAEENDELAPLLSFPARRFPRSSGSDTPDPDAA